MSKKKKHNWMKGFVLPKPTPEIEKIRIEALDSAHQKAIKRTYR
jgi:formiminotetrahydrofolate cyclodeaminase